MTAAVALSNVCVRAGEATLLHDISIGIAPGEIVAVVGPNGAGKSTLMRVLSGDRRPEAGKAMLFGRSIPTMLPAQLAMRRAVLSQHVHVSFPFSVAEIVAMGGHNAPAHKVRALVGEMLDEVELSDFAARDITTLSGGEQQRAHLARVLVQLACAEAHGQPSVLLLDEPTASLDLRHQINLIESAHRRARNGTTVVAVLHDLNLAAAFAPRILIFHNGRCVGDGSPEATVTSKMLRSVFGVEMRESLRAPTWPAVLPDRLRTLPID